MCVMKTGALLTRYELFSFFSENHIVFRWREKILHIPDVPKTEVKGSKLRFLALLIFVLNGIFTGFQCLDQGCPSTRAPCSLTPDCLIPPQPLMANGGIRFNLLYWRTQNPGFWTFPA